MAETPTDLNTVAEVTPSGDGRGHCLRTGGRWARLSNSAAGSDAGYNG